MFKPRFNKSGCNSGPYILNFPEEVDFLVGGSTPLNNIVIIRFKDIFQPKKRRKIKRLANSSCRRNKTIGNNIMFGGEKDEFRRTIGLMIIHQQNAFFPGRTRCFVSL